MTQPRRKGPLLLKQVVAQIDERTTVICLDAAGQLRMPEEAFETLNGEFQAPPFHLHCRDLVAAWLPGMVDTQREAANAELRKRPLKQRQKNLEGVGARKIPVPDKPAVPDVPPVEPLPEQLGEDRASLRATFSMYRDLTTGMDALEPREETARVAYIADGFEVLNRGLREGGKFPDGESYAGLSYTDMDRSLRSAFGRVKTTAAVVVFRGAGSSSRLANVAVGDVLHDDAPMSTAVLAQTARDFMKDGGRMLQILVPAGHPALLGAQNEFELILPPGTTLRVVEVDEDTVKAVIV
jgi:hypothetical protein